MSCSEPVGEVAERKRWENWEEMRDASEEWSQRFIEQRMKEEEKSWQMRLVNTGGVNERGTSTSIWKVGDEIDT